MKRKILSTFIATTSIVGLLISSAACSSDTVDSAADTAAASIVSSEHTPEVESSSQYNEPPVSSEPTLASDPADRKPESTDQHQGATPSEERDQVSSVVDEKPTTVNTVEANEESTLGSSADVTEWDSSCPLTETAETWSSGFDYYGASVSDRTWGTVTSMYIENFDCFTRLMIELDLDPDINNYNIPIDVTQNTCLGVNDTCPGKITMAAKSSLEPGFSLQSERNLFAVTEAVYTDSDEFTVQYDLHLDRNIVVRLHEKRVGGKEYLAIDFTDGRLG